MQYWLADHNEYFRAVSLTGTNTGRSGGSPDLGSGLDTSAPTVSRQGIMLLLHQILTSNLDKKWQASAGDITAAFLNGSPLKRELYIRQPRYGIGNLHPEQIIKLDKGVFGLVDSPSSWWKELRRSLLDMDVVTGPHTKARFNQCPLDPCIFVLQNLNQDNEQIEEPIGYLAVHVDDLLLIGEEGPCEALRKELSKKFPVADWEINQFEYIGSFIEVSKEGVKVSQTSYAETRLFEVTVNDGQDDHELATEEQKADNPSLVGALSWLAGQTRPDLQTGVSMAQQLHRSDVRFSNQLSRRARQLKDQGVPSTSTRRSFWPTTMRHGAMLHKIQMTHSVVEVGHGAQRVVPKRRVPLIETKSLSSHA